MDTKDIKNIIKIFEQSTLHKMELEIPDLKVKLEKENTYIKSDYIHMKDSSEENLDNIDASSNNDSSKTNIREEEIKSPLVGVFYITPGEDSKPFVSVGDRVKQGQTLCIVEAMKVMNEIKAPKDLIIKQINFKNGDMVQFDDVLFVVGD